MGAIQEHYNTGTLANFVVPWMPIDYQVAAAKYFDQKKSKLDTLIATIREAGDRLRELRTALTSAAVTGKIDVREETP